ncbi:MAG: GNAT family N-acetyltransferase [Defluviicoccus sp.]|nr:GNAT family N-acetyltransferase [Defluviicoccus sp.]
MIAVLPVGGEAAAGLAFMHACCFDEAWDAKTFQTLLRMPGAFAHVAWTRAEPAEPVGFVIWRRAGDDAEVMSIGVLPGQRGRRLGRRLLRTVILAATREGARRLVLEVAEGNAAARTLYAQMRLTEVGRRRGYYRKTHGAAEDALIMARDL